MFKDSQSNNLVLTTKDLRQIAREAHRLGLNEYRRLTAAQFKLLDPKGTHILSPRFMHDRAEGELVEPHLRMHAHIKLIGKQGAVEKLLDIPLDFVRGFFSDEFLREMAERGLAQGSMDVDSTAAFIDPEAAVQIRKEREDMIEMAKRAEGK